MILILLGEIFFCRLAADKYDDSSHLKNEVKEAHRYQEQCIVIDELYPAQSSWLRRVFDVEEDGPRYEFKRQAQEVESHHKEGRLVHVEFNFEQDEDASRWVNKQGKPEVKYVLVGVGHIH